MYTHMSVLQSQKKSPIVAPLAMMGVKGPCLKAPEFLTKVRKWLICLLLRGLCLPIFRFGPDNLGVACLLLPLWLCFFLQLLDDCQGCQRYTGCNYRSKHKIYRRVISAMCSWHFIVRFKWDLTALTIECFTLLYLKSVCFQVYYCLCFIDCYF